MTVHGPDGSGWQVRWNSTKDMRRYGQNGVYASNPVYWDGIGGYFGSQSDGDPQSGGLLFSIWRDPALSRHSAHAHSKAHKALPACLVPVVPPHAHALVEQMRAPSLALATVTGCGVQLTRIRMCALAGTARKRALTQRPSARTPRRRTQRGVCTGMPSR